MADKEEEGNSTGDDNPKIGEAPDFSANEEPQETTSAEPNFSGNENAQGATKDKSKSIFLYND